MSVQNILQFTQIIQRLSVDHLYDLKNYLLNIAHGKSADIFYIVEVSSSPLLLNVVKQVDGNEKNYRVEDYNLQELQLKDDSDEPCISNTKNRPQTVHLKPVYQVVVEKASFEVEVSVDCANQ